MADTKTKGAATGAAKGTKKKPAKKAKAKAPKPVGGPKAEAKDHKRYATVDGPVAADGTPLPGHKDHGKQPTSSRPVGADWPGDTGEDQDLKGTPHPDDPEAQQLPGCATEKAPTEWTVVRKLVGDRIIENEDGDLVCDERVTRTYTEDRVAADTETEAVQKGAAKMDQRQTFEQFKAGLGGDEFTGVKATISARLAKPRKGT